MNPLAIVEDYNPTIEDELLKGIGELVEEPLVLTVLTVPQDITKMTANLKAPIVINANTLKGCQIIIEDDKYLVKHPIYDIISRRDGE